MRAVPRQSEPDECVVPQPHHFVYALGDSFPQRDLLERGPDANGDNVAVRISQQESGFEGVGVRRVQDVRQRRFVDGESAPFDFNRRLAVDNAGDADDDCQRHESSPCGTANASCAS